MQSLLAVPVLCTSPFRGNLYLANEASGEPFSVEDEQTLERLAAQAALAIDTAYLHGRVKSLAVSEERARLAREVHDGVAQVLAYVNTKAQAVREYLAVGRSEEASRQLEQLASAARGVYTDVREGIVALRSAPERGETFSEALSRYLEKWSHESGVAVDATIDDGIRFDTEVELQLFRILQEALINVRKHAEVERAGLSLRHRGDEIIAVVEDQGVGLKGSRPEQRGRPRFGLAIMRERAESVGGRLEISSAGDRGTRVSAFVPAANQPKDEAGGGNTP